MIVFLYVMGDGSGRSRQGTYPTWAAALEAITPEMCAGYWSIYVSSDINDTIHLVIDL